MNTQTLQQAHTAHHIVTVADRLHSLATTIRSTATNSDISVTVLVFIIVKLLHCKNKKILYVLNDDRQEGLKQKQST